MAFTAKDLIAIAQAEIGYKGKKTNSQLDSKTANAGGKYTKYARDLAKAGYYNGNKNGFDWCDVFVDWCFYQLCGKDVDKAEQLEYQTGDLGAGCTWSMGYYKNAGRLYKTPKVGDQIFFGSGNSSYHTGIVETVSATQITTIEGNTSGMVARRTYNINDSTIAGYGRPKFDVESAKTTTTTKPSASTKFAKGDKVKVKKAVTYDGKSFGVFFTEYDVIEVSGDRVVIGIGKTTTAAVNAANLTAVKKTTTTKEPAKTIKEGGKVKVVKAVTYDGQSFKAFYSKYDVLEIKGDRVVIGVGKTITAAVNIKNLKAV